MVIPLIKLPKAPAATLADLYVDGMPLDNLQALYNINTRLLGGQKWNGPNQFWATPPRHAGSADRDVMEVRLNAPKLVNRFSFQVSRFPCRAWLQWFDEKSNKWKPVRNRRTKKPVQITVGESVPKRIYQNVHGTAHRHPQHHGAGHWRDVEIKSKPVRASRFRLVLTHIPSNNVPVEIGSKKVIPYSLAIKDLQIGHEANSRSQIPRQATHTQIVSDSSSFASSTDLLGSGVEFSLVEYRASDLLWPTLETIAGVPANQRTGTNDVWKCEPQPVPYAVVNLYADARDSKGNGQSIDRFFINPTTSGVACNLYYSNDTPDPSLGFEASDEPVRYPALQLHGTVVPGVEGLFFSRDVYGFLDLDNKSVQLNDASPWWVGMEFQPQFDSSDTNDWVLIETPRFSVRWSNGSWIFNVDGVEQDRSNQAFEVNDTLAFTITHEPGQAVISMSDGWSQVVFLPPASPGRLDAAFIAANPVLAHTARFGGMLVPDDQDPGFGNYRLNGYVMKQEAGTADITAEFFATDLDQYMLPADVDEDDRDFTTNALLRVHPYYQTTGTSSTNPFGFVGGPGTSYESLVWTPISRDYRLHKGFLQFDPVLAKFFKFEFTSLVPVPYSSYEPMSRKVRLFTADTVALSQGIRTAAGPSDSAAGTSVNLASSLTPLFSDQARVQSLVDPNRSYPGYTPTEAMYSKDPVAHESLATLNPAFRLQPWRASGNGAPRFVNVQRHYYETVTVSHKSKIAFGVGLSELRMFKVDYTVADDTDAYLLPFHDTSGIDTEFFDWTIDTPSGLLAPSALTGVSSTVTSLPLLSRRNVRGIQFATVQTPAHQVLADPDFNDPALTYWEPYGGAQIEVSTDFNSDIGSTLKVTRAIQGKFWASAEQVYSSWDAIEALNDDPNLPTWDDVTAPSGDVTSFGGVTGKSNSLVPTPGGGRIYAAARVYTPQALTEPLHVQLVTDTGAVLAEESIFPQAGTVTEWFTGYTVGSTGTTDDSIPSWDDLEALDIDPSLPSWVDLEAIGTWDQVAGGTLSPYDGPVTARLFQSGDTQDTFYIDNVSVYEDPILWEFSNNGGEDWWPAYDIRNNPQGVLLFPSTPEDTLATTADQALRWRVTTFRGGVRVTALFIRPWYSTLRFGVTPRETLAHGGPNISKYDQYPSVVDSPPFKVWNKPIPEDWWFLYRQWLLQGGLSTATEAPVVVPQIVLGGESFVL